MITLAIDEITKKEQIINFAQNDPFLKISDIARQVQTTPRYVRTILSEANISLMKLRERYARSIEERLEEKEIPRRITLILKGDKKEVTMGPLEWEEMHMEDQDLHRRKPQEALIRLSQRGHLESKAFYWLDAQAYLEKELMEANISQAGSMEDLLRLCGCQKVHFSENRISLARRREDQTILLHFQRDIRWNDLILGRENRYYLPEAVDIIVPGEVFLGTQDYKI